MSGPRVRPGSPADHEAVLEIARSLARWFHPLEQVALAIDLRLHHLLVVERGDEMVGFLTYHLPERGLVELSWLGVREASQGQGLGAALLTALEREARRRRATRIQVGTVDGSSAEPAFEATRRFYYQHNFRPIGRDLNYFAPGRHRLLLEKAVGPGKR